MSRRRRARAIGHLGALYARHLVRRATRRRVAGEGLGAFEALYAAERITPVTVAERGRLAGHGDCVACGLCSFAAPRSGYLTAERLPLQLTRSLSGLWTARDLDLGGLDWGAAGAVCPLGVPHAEIADLVDARLARDGAEPPPRRRPPLLPRP